LWHWAQNRKTSSSVVPKALRKWRFSFEDTHLTHFGGLVLFQRFCQKLQLRRRLQRRVKISQRNADYLPADLLLAMIYAVAVGVRRINKTELLQYNGAFLDLLGLDRFPNETTLRRFLQRLSPQNIRQLVVLHDWLRAQFLIRATTPSSLILDLDSVVLTLYGHQQGARVGYNPKKKGRRSYHPALCFEAYHQEFWHGSLRPGNTSANTGVIFFLQRCLAKVPTDMARSRIRARADSGFFGGKFLVLLERLGLGYVIVAKNYRTLKSRAREARFRILQNGMAVAEFQYQAHGWPKARRCVVMRRPIPEDPLEAKQLTLFKDRRYAYSVMVTNLSLDPWRVWKFYQPRATVEKNIRELLYDMPLGKIPSGDWLANVAFFHIVLFAYDLVHWFRRLCLPLPYKTATVETVRSDFLVLPARLVSRAGQNMLQLPKDYLHRQAFLSAFTKASALRISKTI
jgi:hypothetical protein